MNARDFQASHRGTFIQAQALYYAIQKLSEVEGVLQEKSNIAEVSNFVCLSASRDRRTGPPNSLILKFVSGFIPADLRRAFTLWRVPFDLIISPAFIKILLHISF